MQTETTILLCGGQINYINLPIGTNTSNSMIPVNGKPVIAWILDDLLSKDIHDVTILLRQNDDQLFTFLQRAFTSRINLRFAFLQGEGTIIQSLETCLQENNSYGIVRVILGDTLIRDSYSSEHSFAYTASVSESRRWCLVTCDEKSRITSYYDKKINVQPPYIALAGYYHFINGNLLRNCVKEAITHNEKELSDVLRRYGQTEPIYSRTADEWYDFGNMDRLVEARQKLLQPRFFNTITINPTLGTITKISKNNQKLQDELDWYLDIPDSLKVLTPRIFHFEPQNRQVQIVQEYYGYPTLSELYVYGELHTDTWISILNRVLAIHIEFSKYQGFLEVAQIKEMYINKLFHRLDALIERDNQWKEFLALPEFTFNGIQLKGLPVLNGRIIEQGEKISKTTSISIIHGDYCFSNILFDINNQIIRLIDPRGRFGKKGIYGDPRYDIAKLRHSVREYYDFIIADMFDGNMVNGEYWGNIYTNDVQTDVGVAFDNMIVSLGYDLNEIKYIEGLLFISMLPLHQDNRKRQEMMFFTGLKLLNEVL